MLSQTSGPYWHIPEVKHLIYLLLIFGFEVQCLRFKGFQGRSRKKICSKGDSSTHSFVWGSFDKFAYKGSPSQNNPKKNLTNNPKTTGRGWREHLEGETGKEIPRSSGDIVQQNRSLGQKALKGSSSLVSL